MQEVLLNHSLDERFSDWKLYATNQRKMTMKSTRWNLPFECLRFSSVSFTQETIGYDIVTESNERMNESLIDRNLQPVSKFIRKLKEFLRRWWNCSQTKECMMINTRFPKIFTTTITSQGKDNRIIFWRILKEENRFISFL